MGVPVTAPADWSLGILSCQIPDSSVHSPWMGPVVNELNVGFCSTNIGVLQIRASSLF